MTATFDKWSAHYDFILSHDDAIRNITEAWPGKFDNFVFNNTLVEPTTPDIAAWDTFRYFVSLLKVDMVFYQSHVPCSRAEVLDEINKRLWSFVASPGLAGNSLRDITNNATFTNVTSDVTASRSRRIVNPETTDLFSSSRSRSSLSRRVEDSESD